MISASLPRQYATVVKRVAAFSLPDRMRERLFPEFNEDAGQAVSQDSTPSMVGRLRNRVSNRLSAAA